VQHGSSIWCRFPSEHGGHPRQPRGDLLWLLHDDLDHAGGGDLTNGLREGSGTPYAAPSSSKKSKTHPPKPYDIVQGMERIIDMMEETLQICERAQRSTQDASHRKTFHFDLWPPSDVYARQAAKSIQIQSGRQQPSGDLKVETRARRDPLDVPCIYHKGAWHTLRGCRLRKQIDQKRDASHTIWAPMSPDDGEF
jgi:hypothetical protein